MINQTYPLFFIFIPLKTIKPSIIIKSLDFIAQKGKEINGIGFKHLNEDKNP